MRYSSHAPFAKPSEEGFTALSALFAASNASARRNAHEMALLYAFLSFTKLWFSLPQARAVEEICECASASEHERITYTARAGPAKAESCQTMQKGPACRRTLFL